ncbi:MAG: hypothetical protein AB8B95_10665 [Pseudohongiellaceae bacterium]
MEFTTKRTAQTAAYLLLALALTQALYTGLSAAGISVPRSFIWGLESLLFTFLAAMAGAALAQTQNYHVGWSAIGFSAVLNVVQVSVGLTMFSPFFEAAGQVEGMAPAAGAVVAFAFMIYYAAKLLLGFAALIFGMAKLNAGSKGLGGLTALVGGFAMLSNGALIMLGRSAFIPSPIAGGTGVVATLLLALCILSMNSDD